LDRGAAAYVAQDDSRQSQVGDNPVYQIAEPVDVVRHNSDVSQVLTLQRCSAEGWSTSVAS